MNRWTSMLIVIALALLASCKSEQEQREEELAEVFTPLIHDPTDTFELARWWSNGTHLLRLDDNDFFALYRGNNRYSVPLERGRWGQTSYAVLILEPYDTLKAQRIRVGISRVDGELTLNIPKLEPMTAIDRPPMVVEDRLLGAWEGEMGVLRLSSDGTYTLTPHPVGFDQPVVLAGHDGTWHVVGGDVVLQPRTPGANAIRLPFTIIGDTVSLTGADGPMIRRTTS